MYGKKMKETVCILMTFLMLCVFSACDGSARTHELTAESFFCDDTLYLPVSVKTWPDGKWDSCKFACRNERHMMRILEKGCRQSNPSVNWKIEYDEDHRQMLVPFEENANVRTEIKAYSNGSILITKYRNGDVFSTYVAVLHDGAAVLSGTYGEFTVPGEKDVTVRLLFPIHLLAEPKEFETEPLFRGRRNSLDEEFKFMSSYEDVIQFYEDSGRFKIEKIAGGFLLKGYNPLFSEYAPEVWPPMESEVFFRVSEMDGLCKVHIELWQD